MGYEVSVWSRTILPNMLGTWEMPSVALNLKDKYRQIINMTTFIISLSFYIPRCLVPPTISCKLRFE